MVVKGLDLGYVYKVKKSTCRCNNCMNEYEESDLISFEDEEGRGYGCPICKTDIYLMDIEQ